MVQTLTVHWPVSVLRSIEATPVWRANAMLATFCTLKADDSDINGSLVPRITVQVNASLTSAPFSSTRIRRHLHLIPRFDDVEVRDSFVVRALSSTFY